MTNTILQIGPEIATKIRGCSGNGATTSAVPTTLADLLAIWAENPPGEAAMLATTCARLADYHGIAVSDLTIDAVEQRRKGFRAFLKGRKYSENSIRTYVNHLRLLLNYASAAGWKADDHLTEEWRRVIAWLRTRTARTLHGTLLQTGSIPVRFHPRMWTSGFRQ